jgi:hypothetical protein
MPSFSQADKQPNHSPKTSIKPNAERSCPRHPVARKLCNVLDARRQVLVVQLPISVHIELIRQCSSNLGPVHVNDALGSKYLGSNKVRLALKT